MIIRHYDCGFRIAEGGLRKTEGRRHKAEGSQSESSVSLLPSAFCLLPSGSLSPHSAIRNRHIFCHKSGAGGVCHIERQEFRASIEAILF